jgi:hypothetical protein
VRLPFCTSSMVAEREPVPWTNEWANVAGRGRDWVHSPKRQREGEKRIGVEATWNEDETKEAGAIELWAGVCRGGESVLHSRLLSIADPFSANRAPGLSPSADPHDKSVDSLDICHPPPLAVQRPFPWSLPCNNTGDDTLRSRFHGQRVIGP